MANKNKLQKWTELRSFGNTLEPPVDIKGKWNRMFFKNGNPITLELACGKAEYTLALAARHPNRNFIGIDIKGARIWRGAKTAYDNKIRNVGFLRINIEDINEYFEKDEVEEIWIIFPDPFPRKSKAKKRLTSPRFLEIYRNILKNGGFIHLKTDNEPLIDYSAEVLNEQNLTIHAMIKDIYKTNEEGILRGVQTFYEKQHLKEGRLINYLKFSL